MPPVPEHELKRWLHGEGGYLHTCFVGWAGDAGPFRKKLAQALKRRLEEVLQDQGWAPPSVYLSAESNDPGDDWRYRMREVCCSVVLVALCCPSYYKSPHCQSEWCAMEEIEKTGVRGRIVPVLVTRQEAVPAAVRSRHCIKDLQGVTQYPRWTSTKFFASFAEKIARVAKERAGDLYQQRQEARSVPIVPCSPFADFEPRNPPYPIVEPPR